MPKVVCQLSGLPYHSVKWYASRQMAYRPLCHLLVFLLIYWYLLIYSECVRYCNIEVAAEVAQQIILHRIPPDTI